MKKKRIIARLDIKGPHLIKSINLEGLKKLDLLKFMLKSTTIKKQMN